MHPLEIQIARLLRLRDLLLAAGLSDLPVRYRNGLRDLRRRASGLRLRRDLPTGDLLYRRRAGGDGDLLRLTGDGEPRLLAGDGDLLFLAGDGDLRLLRSADGDLLRLGGEGDCLFFPGEGDRRLTGDRLLEGEEEWPRLPLRAGDLLADDVLRRRFTGDLDLSVSREADIKKIMQTTSI